MGELKKLGQQQIDFLRGKKGKKNKRKSSEIVLPDEEASQIVARKKAARRFGPRGSGRASTILSNQGQRLGG